MEVKDPVFIIGSYRGGTSLLFRLLSESEELWSMYRESNHIWQSYHRDSQAKSDVVYFEKLDNGKFLNKNTGEEIKDFENKRRIFDLAYHYSTYNNYILGYLGRVKFIREGLPFILGLINYFNYFYKAFTMDKYRVVDKTPPNIFRIDYLAKLYPDAKFVYLTRDANENISSLISAWKHKSKFQYPYRDYLGGNLELSDCDSKVWKFFIPENFHEQDYKGKSVVSVCADQWLSAHKAALESFSKMDKSKFIQIKFEDLLSRPKTVMQEICNFTEVELSEKMNKIIEEMPAVNTDKKFIVSKDSKKKAKNYTELAEVQERLGEIQSQLGYNQSSYVI